ncbi:NAD(P)/FAD-dependent oxidoreductase [Evansella tamaricis]|uniref:FAD-binding oxidoreductase n=1 Tax=Evansella tamaricis TaxID=2069301 RepID=A0ABS6JHJ0_9BACI|nr:FAD-dependent oxidoreductase [Evansella tamaricis]MBU9713097.1 FAD-binding oxidoreductase [Evansella tamaricis]
MGNTTTSKTYIVVGAGILGASTAYHLAKEGKSVTVVDRQDLGQATDAAAGIVCPWLSQRRNKAWYRLVKNGARYYPTLIKELEKDGEEDTGYKQVGAISLHTEEGKLTKMEERAYKRRESAPEIGEITRLSPKETRAIFPPISDGFGSIHISGGARVNGRALRTALLNASVKHGATLKVGNAEAILNNRTITGVMVNGEIINGDKVILTAGAWAKDFLSKMDIPFQVFAQKAQIIHLQLGEGEIATGNWPVVMPPNNQYILSFGGGKVVVGATHEDDVGFDLRVTAGGIHEILNKALSVAHGLGDGAIEEIRVGFRPITPGFLPVFGFVPQVDGLLVANGLGASGLTAGPYLGAELAKLAQNQKTELQLEDYDVRSAMEEDD